MPEQPQQHEPDPEWIPEGSGTAESTSGYASWDQRPALGKRGMVLAVVIPLLIAAAGFGVVSAISNGADVQASSIRVPTSDWIPGQPGGKEQISGTLSVDQRHCVYLDASGRQVWPVWPAGYRARLDSSGKVSLYDGADHLVARDGEGVQATGRFTSPAAYSGETCLPSDGEIAVVQSQVNRLG